jgi:hypothetical protein
MANGRLFEKTEIQALERAVELGAASPAPSATQ